MNIDRKIMAMGTSLFIIIPKDVSNYIDIEKSSEMCLIVKKKDDKKYLVIAKKEDEEFFDV